MIKAITSTWFECSVIVPKVQDDGNVRNVNEVYTVDALTFTEAETRITDEMQPYVANMVGGFSIKNINPAQYKEIFFSEDKKDDRWFKVKVAFPEFDEKAMVMHEKSKVTSYKLTRLRPHKATLTR